MSKACLLIVALLLGLPAAPVRAAVPFEPDRQLGVELASDWLADGFVAPDGTRYTLAGRLSRAALVGQWDHWDARVGGAFVPITRTDQNATVQRLASRGLLTWSLGRLQNVPRFRQDYWLAAGLGLLADYQHHSAPDPLGRARDYLDESQWRVGPVGRLEAIWLNYADDPAWQVRLELLVGPRLWAASTGGVPYPTGWSGAEVVLGPHYRRGPWQGQAGLEGSYWLGNGFSQAALGVSLRASYRL